MSAIKNRYHDEIAAGIGHNNPPLSPYEIAEKRVNDIYGEAKLWLDGAVVDSPELADGIGNLVSEISAAWTLAEETRKAEKKQHDDAAKAVQEKFKPLLDKAILAKDACKKALAPWLRKLADEQERVARLAREEAERKQREAEGAIRKTDLTNLLARAEAEALVTAAKKANAVANRAEKVTAKAGGATGRSVGLRTVWIASIVDPVLAARWAWASHRDEMESLIARLADEDVRVNGAREIPGFKIESEQRAV